MPELIETVATPTQEIPQTQAPVEPTAPEGTNPETQETQETQEDNVAKPRDRELARKWRKYNRQMEAYQKERAEFDNIQNLAKTNPVEFLKKYGVTLEDWATGSIETPETKAMSEVEKLKAEIKKEKEEAERIRTEAQYKQNQGIIQEAVAAKLNPETHIHLSALINEGLLKKQDLISDLTNQLQESYLANQDLQEDLEDLAPNKQEELVAKWMDKEISKYYTQLESEYQSQLVALKTIIDKLAITPTPGKADPKNNPQGTKPQTLTNAMSSVTGNGEAPKFKTEEEVLEWIAKKRGWQV